MPWCPKCKTEYREGFTICADCGSELVAEEPVEKPEMSECEKTSEVIWQEEAADEVEETPAETAEQTGATNASSAAPYRDSSERASENRSSAWMLLILGVLGIVAVALGVTGVLPLNLGNPYLFYGVMGAVFILFVVAGVVSLKNAKIFEKKAESENSLRETLQEWCRENLNAEEIDAQIGLTGDSVEITYFNRFDYIKARLNHQFVNLDQGFLDKFIDDYVYDEVFGEKA